MVDYISGKITELSPTKVVVENQGIGYALEISLQTYSKLEGHDQGMIFVQTQANPREGTSIDYGFGDKDEREIFRMITGVSGMGASSARMILSSLTSDELRETILSEDVNRLKSVKGIGLKTAQRIILELKDKLVKGDSASSDILFSADNNSNIDEATSALLMLGFSKPNISKALQSIIKTSPKASVEQLIKCALQIL